jgi:multiple sugar transport system ATP-binding protein
LARVTLENVQKEFESIRAVDNLNLDIEDGEFVTLLGPSGCGKSTTLACVAGLEDPTSGWIKFDDRVVNDLSPRDRDIAMVFQDYALYPHMSVYKNLAFALELRNMSKDVIQKNVTRVADFLGLGSLLDRRPAHLSGGQRQRVALGRAIVRNPVVFLMDEPLSNLDAALRVSTRTEIKQLQQELKTTTLFVTHDQEEAMVLSDRIAIMKLGVLQQFGAPHQIYSDPTNVFVAGFIGSPKMNFITGQLERDAGGALFSAVDAGPAWHLPGVSAPETPIAVVMGVRPEHVSLERQAANGTMADIGLVEPVGPTTFVDLEVGGAMFKASTDPESNFRPSEKVSVALNPKRVYFFEPKSGERIRL